MFLLDVAGYKFAHTDHGLSRIIQDTTCPLAPEMKLYEELQLHRACLRVDLCDFAHTEMHRAHMDDTTLYATWQGVVLIGSPMFTKKGLKYPEPLCLFLAPLTINGASRFFGAPLSTSRFHSRYLLGVFLRHRNQKISITLQEVKALHILANVSEGMDAELP